MINFSKINAFDKGQSDSFEDLVCILAKRERPADAVEFQANEGSGGDGGVEAIWLLSDGHKVGYQAKFFLSIESSQWQQMDKSVKQALKVHPELINYIFALPRDLTPDRGGGRKSKRQMWDEHVLKWKGWAEEKSINIEFELWSETDLKEMLLREGNAPLIKLWFGTDVLNDAWFSNQVEVAVQTLDERFNPDDHVEVAIEELFDYMVRGQKISEKLEKIFDELKQNRVPVIDFEALGVTLDNNVPLAINETLNELIALKDTFSADYTKCWGIVSVLSVVNRLHDEVRKLDNECVFIDKQHLAEEDKEKLDKLTRSLHKISSLSYSITKLFKRYDFKAEAEQCALIYGPSGAGKSHILGQVAKQRVDSGLPTILILGQGLSDSFFWEQISSVLGIEGKSAEDILGTLNAAGERIGERVLLLFDAINEGAGVHYWNQNLQQVITAVQRYPYLAVVFSCRDEYVPYAIPKSLSEKLPKFEIKGFVTAEEVEQAAIKYLDAKGIARPNIPLLSPEFSNPLFLKSVSEALKANGESQFPRGLHGVSQVLAYYLDALSYRTELGVSNSDDISDAIKRCLGSFAGKMASTGCDFVEFKDAVALADESFTGRTPPVGKFWLNILIETNILRRDPPPYFKEYDPFDPPRDIVRIAFQRFQDHLVAKSLVSQLKENGLDLAFENGGPLNFLFRKGQLEHGIDYIYAGLVSSLSIIFPEELGIEFAHTLPDWKQSWDNYPLLQEAFAESLKWRSINAFSKATEDLFHDLDEQNVDVFELLLEVSMTDGHPFNAEYLHSLLKAWTMPERDSHWTRWINWAAREKFGQLERIISWALSKHVKIADEKHQKLASIVLTWFLSSSYMTLRDRATKALTSLLLGNSSIFVFVLEKMHDCDDPYVIERLYAAAFGACCIDQSHECLNQYSYEIYSKVFLDKQPPVALLTRDYALGIIELASYKSALHNDISLEDCYHPFNSEAPEFDLSEEIVEAIADQRGGKQIFYSASSECGDYGNTVSQDGSVTF